MMSELEFRTFSSTGEWHPKVPLGKRDLLGSIRTIKLEVGRSRLPDGTWASLMFVLEKVRNSNLEDADGITSCYPAMRCPGLFLRRI